MANSPVIKRTQLRLVEYAKPVRMKGIGAPRSAHLSSEGVTLECDTHFVYASSKEGSVMVPMANVVRLEPAL